MITQGPFLCQSVDYKEYFSTKIIKIKTFCIKLKSPNQNQKVDKYYFFKK